jgi:type I restriction enzyme R subunit
MRLLIVVDKLLTGFDAPSATVLYIDKPMQDHGLFQAICRVNRLDGDDKQYGMIVDYRDLFRHLEGAVRDYAAGALSGFAPEDVSGLIHDRLEAARESLDAALEAVRTLCEPVPLPRGSREHLLFFCGRSNDDEETRRRHETLRRALYRLVAALITAYGGVANDMVAVGYTEREIGAIRAEVRHFTNLRDEVKIASGDHIDLKAYEPAMRQLIDLYVRASDSETLTNFDDLTLVELILERGEAALELLPKAIREDPEAVSETIENNVRRRIIEEQTLNPRYYEKMSALLEALINQRREGAVTYKDYLERFQLLVQQVVRPGTTHHYPTSVGTPRARALYDALQGDETKTLTLEASYRREAPHGWRTSPRKRERVKDVIDLALSDADEATRDTIYTLFERHDD